MTGTIEKSGSYAITLIAKNFYGSLFREFTLKVGDKLALTPPMGWNSWYIHYDRISDKTMREAADQMIATGMADYGYQYVNIDDWGFDFLKYDWCSYRKVAGGKSDPDYFIRPYRLIWDELLKQNRDIVLNLCQYGMGNVWEWGGEVGNCWRTTGDLGLEERRNLPGFYSIGLSNAQHWEFAQPGAWNDPDYILIGWVGNAHGMEVGTPTDLTPWEQYSYMSMWSLMAAPLIFIGDMAKLDRFTLNVLCNHEVIEVNQDPLGMQAVLFKKTDQQFVMVKPMLDGSMSVGIFNLDNEVQNVNISWTDLKISGEKRVRDIWRQKDLGLYSDHFTTEIQPHGVTLIRFFNE